MTTDSYKIYKYRKPIYKQINLSNVHLEICGTESSGCLLKVRIPRTKFNTIVGVLWSEVMSEDKLLSRLNIVLRTHTMCEIKPRNNNTRRLSNMVKEIKQLQIVSNVMTE